MSTFKKIALYASYQTGKDLPGYVQFALSHLAKTDFHVVLLTNERELSQESYEFIADNDIELFLTPNCVRPSHIAESNATTSGFDLTWDGTD